jgi:predicted phage terminase large subunit-like protein
MVWDWQNLNRTEIQTVLFKQVIRNPYIPIKPTSKQLQFLSIFEEESLYGGAAGGGKSAALLADALMFVTEPNYNALILRKNYQQLTLPGALIDLSKQWLMQTDAKWNDTDKQWRFPSGATLNFGYLDSENDVYRYQGSAFHFIGFDELTQFTETKYLYLFSRMRKNVDSSFPLRFRAGSNPGGVGHEWVKERFIPEYDDNEQLIRKTALFVPAKLEDNPHVDQEAYERSLAKLDPITRAQLRYGNWDVASVGNYFKKEKFKIVDECPRGLTVRFWDMAATKQKNNENPDYTVGVKMTISKGMFWVQDVVRGRWNPAELEDVVRKTAEQDGQNVRIFMEQEPGSSGKIAVDHYARNVLCGYSFTPVVSSGSKENRAKPFSAAVENGYVHLLKGAWNNRYINELIVFPQPEFHDDQVDGSSGAYNQLVKTGSREISTTKIERASKVTNGYDFF